MRPSNGWPSPLMSPSVWRSDIPTSRPRRGAALHCGCCVGQYTGRTTSVESNAVVRFADRPASIARLSTQATLLSAV
jgi:hypothetical protein